MIDRLRSKTNFLIFSPFALFVVAFFEMKFVLFEESSVFGRHETIPFFLSSSCITANQAATNHFSVFKIPEKYFLTNNFII